MQAKYIILGSGIGGHTAAKEIRSQDPEASILIIGEEDQPTYYRTQLTHKLSEDFSLEDILLKSEEWYEENNIDLVLGTRVESLDEEAMTLRTEDGQLIEGEKILLASGSEPRLMTCPGYELKGVTAMRTYEDVKKLQDFLEDKKRALVIGGGVLGLEAAASLKEMGKEVYILNRSSYVLNRQLDEDLGMKLNKVLEEEGFKLLMDTEVTGFEGQEELEAVKLEDGTRLEMDLAICSIGVVPLFDFLDDSQLERGERGHILVDGQMRTSAENIYAAGDVVEVHGASLGLWTAAMAMGKVAGHNMASEDKTSYDQPQPFTQMNLGFIEVFSAGEVHDCDQVLTYEEDDFIAKLFAKEGLVTGGILFGQTKKMGKMKKLVFSQRPVEEAKDELFPFS